MGTNISVINSDDQHEYTLMFNKNSIDADMSGEDEDEDDEFDSQAFHNTVREYIIFLLFFLTLICVSSCLIDLLHVQKSSSTPQSTSGSSSPQGRNKSGGKKRKVISDDDESVVKRICSWLCTFTLSTSIGATLLLPISILSNEVLLLYPTNKYLEWLNGMLIQGLWNLVFLFSNIGLFVLLPFAHLFIEAEGFSGKKQGLASKLQETVVVLILMSGTVWGLAVIANSLFRGTTPWIHFNQLPFIYSCISFCGVLVLTICTPLGLSRLFTILSDNFVFVPEFLRNLENEHVCAVLEYERLKNQRQNNILKRNQNDQQDVTAMMLKMEENISRLETLRTTPAWKRNLLYPGLFACVLFVTGLTVFIVLINAIKIVAGFRDLSLEVVAKETLPLGGSSLSFLGPSGAFFEIILVLYLITTCLVGLYSLPVFRSIVPQLQATSTSHLISNCAVMLLLSSALPVFMRILGLTNFDLLGTFAGKIDWIESTLIVVFVNVLFSVLTVVCLVNKVTRKISNEILRSFKGVFKTD